MKQAVEFLYKRGTEFAKFHSDSKSIDEKTQNLLRFLKPAIPPMVYTGLKPSELPALESDRDAVVILANHQSDMDQAIVMHSLNYHFDTPHPLRVTGFTHGYFRKLPLIGSLIDQDVIGLNKGDSAATISSKVEAFWNRGFNAFLLFPEGHIHCRDTKKKSDDFCRKSDVAADFHHVLFPRFGAYQALLNTLQDRVKYIVDFTIVYASHHPQSHNWSYLTYPAFASAFVNPFPEVQVHMVIYRVKPDQWQKVSDKQWLIKLWQQKNRRIQHNKTKAENTSP